MKKYLLASTLLHLSLLFISAKHAGNLLNQGGKGSGSNLHGGVAIDKDIIPKSRTTEVAIIEKHPDIIIKSNKHKIVDKDCPGSWYGGIGIETVDNGAETIGTVHSGYPADLAGLLEGDEVVSVEGNYIPGPPGTEVTMLIKRNGISRVYTITRGKICY